MLKRIITGVVAFLVLFPFLVFSEQVPFLVPFMTAVLGLIAMYEYFSCVGASHDLVVSLPGYLLAFNLPLCTWVAESLSSYLVICLAAFVFYLIYLFTVAVFRRGKMTYGTLASLFSMVLYITLSFVSVSLLRHHVAGGRYIYLLIFIGAWTTDTFAYFTGRVFGKHKLNPEISPKKTVEGSIGGMICSVGGYLLFGWILSLGAHVTPNYLLLVIFGLVASFVAQIGDLITSLIKREHGVKDFGWVFPGHGGVLDRFDSVLAVAPILLLLCALGDGSLLPIAL